VNFQTDKGHFHCPCHDSSFSKDGSILDPKSPSARPLDDLPVEIRNGTEIWVKFQNFRAGVHEKIPV
jgi:Rieske Fe-S protein